MCEIITRIRTIQCRHSSTFLLLFLLLFSNSIKASVIYVKDRSSGTGCSWSDAFGSLQEALDNSTSGDEIWVAAGMYYPTYDYGLDIGEHGKHFRIKKGVPIYGGFNGTEITFEQRDIANNKTILSGDIGVRNDPNDNCDHVFFHPYDIDLDPNDVLDGFTITGGNQQNGCYGETGGGGMLNLGCSPTIKNCIFTNNSAEYWGGGMCNIESSPVVANCIFSGNLTCKKIFISFPGQLITLDGGGGMLNGNQNDYFFAEVKFSKDKLSGEQKKWIRANNDYLHLPFKLIKIHKIST